MVYSANFGLKGEEPVFLIAVQERQFYVLPENLTFVPRTEIHPGRTVANRGEFLLESLQFQQQPRHCLDRASLA